MASTCGLRPFRDYDEHDVINLFSFNSATSLPQNKGTFVTASAGWNNAYADSTLSTSLQETALLGDVGAAYGNTVSERYGTVAKVGPAASGDSAPLGMTLYDCKETDENGEKLVFNPRKAAEMQAVVSGQAVPVVTKGIFVYSGVAGTPALNGSCYVGTDGVLTAVGNADGKVVGKFLGTKDAHDNVLFKLEL
tara:strand:- start:684 stop:1262 length:579 start_codon:yes stop_codon:yes gene_type:complete